MRSATCLTLARERAGVRRATRSSDLAGKQAFVPLPYCFLCVLNRNEETKSYSPVDRREGVLRSASPRMNPQSLFPGCDPHAGTDAAFDLMLPNCSADRTRLSNIPTASRLNSSSKRRPYLFLGFWSFFSTASALAYTCPQVRRHPNQIAS